MNKIELISKYNIYGRQAISLNQHINAIKANIWISKNSSDRQCNAKSLLGLLSLGIKKDEKIIIKTDSEDYSYIFDLISKMVEGDFE